MKNRLHPPQLVIFIDFLMIIIFLLLLKEDRDTITFDFDSYNLPNTMAVVRQEGKQYYYLADGQWIKTNEQWDGAIVARCPRCGEAGLVAIRNPTAEEIKNATFEQCLAVSNCGKFTISINHQGEIQVTQN